MLASALPKQPLIDFKSASADEQVLVVHASSDIDPGDWYVYYRDKKALALVSPARPASRARRLSPVKAISYPAADGTQIPAYLTLPPGVTDAKNLPAIVLPHGGPGARDEWGFDWLAQFFAQRGFVVLQPNFRGSDGYGAAWFANNGFQGWKTSIGDVCDAGRWLVAQGMADSSKLAVRRLVVRRIRRVAGERDRRRPVQGRDRDRAGHGPGAAQEQGHDVFGRLHHRGLRRQRATRQGRLAGAEPAGLQVAGAHVPGRHGPERRHRPVARTWTRNCATPASRAS